MTIKYKVYLDKIDKSVPHVLLRLCKSRGFPDSRLVVNWEEIVGYELSKLYLPNKIIYSRSIKKNKTLQVSGNQFASTVFIYYKHAIKERINNFFGFDFIQDVFLKVNVASF